VLRANRSSRVATSTSPALSAARTRASAALSVFAPICFSLNTRSAPGRLQGDDLSIQGLPISGDTGVAVDHCTPRFARSLASAIAMSRNLSRKKGSCSGSTPWRT
jgi:hypothetical protein